MSHDHEVKLIGGEARKRILVEVYNMFDFNESRPVQFRK
jgi:hypothetical protein